MWKEANLFRQVSQVGKVITHLYPLMCVTSTKLLGAELPKLKGIPRGFAIRIDHFNLI